MEIRKTPTVSYCIDGTHHADDDDDDDDDEDDDDDDDDDENGPGTSL